jgi:hypothetical protein
MSERIDLSPEVINALGTLEQALLDPRGAVDDRLSCGPAEHPTPEETELAVLLEALEQLVVLAGGTDG